MHSFQYLALLALIGLCGLSFFTAADDAGEDAGSNRQKKLLSVFNIVTFNNDPCNGNNNKNGTCYTQQECENKGGVASGSCASSYGVCCTLSVGCGGRSSENCTYFEVSNVNSGACKTTICPCNQHICQLRLDFNSFVITGPSTSTVSVGLTKNGAIISGGTVPVTQATQCLTDTFTVTGNGYTPPSICGTNTGEHMYVDADRSCNDLEFNIGNNAVGTGAAANREINIKVTQIGCDHPNRAPEGCTQWHFGNSGTGIIKSFNYDGGAHLANQDQNICIRRESGNCKICYAAVTTDQDFSVSGPTTKKAKTNMSFECCGYAAAGDGTSGFDCLQIPGTLQKVGGTMLTKGLGFLCGRRLGTADTGESMTVCQQGNSFNVRFLSDQFEVGGAAPMEAAVTNTGFRLAYTQGTC